MARRTIAIHFVHSALRGAREQGLDVWPVLLRAGIPRALLDDPRARVTREQYAELIRGLWDVMGDEFLGLVDYKCKRGTFAMMCLVALGSPDLATALRRAAAFYALFPTEIRFRLTTDEDTFRLVIDLGTVPDPDHFATECLLMIWHRVVSWLIDRPVRLLQLEFGYQPPPHVAEYGPIFGCPMSYGHPCTTLVFDAAYLRAPIVQDEAGLWARMANAPDDLITPPRPASSYTDRVRRILVRGHGLAALRPEEIRAEDVRRREDLGPRRGESGRRREGGGHRMAGLTETAARLTVSPQTLRRHLQAEGTSFRALKEEVLRDAAIAALADGRQSVEEIAGRLGFADASAFHRAFKRWTGTTPGAYRSIEHESNN